MMSYYLTSYLIALLIVGYTLPTFPKVMARWLAWVIAIVTVGVSAYATSAESPLVRMTVLASLQLVALKNIVAVESCSFPRRINIIQWIAFSLAWFGMRPALFENLSSKPLGYRHVLWKGLSRLVIGFLFLLLSAVIEQHATNWMLGLLGDVVLLIGLSLILHFGILNLATSVWRFFGVNATELFNAPLKSKSLREFWGRRWNAAFSEMTALVCYKPLKRIVGSDRAFFIAFLFSGLLHELAISLPVMDGFGFPMLYFIFHGIAIQIEIKSSFIQKLISHRIASRVWVFTWLIMPLPLLFHSPFISNVLIPLRDTLCGWAVA